jgi:DNA-binding MarR family transcriptional regulator
LNVRWNPKNTNHIGKALDLSQPTVFKSVHLLEQDNYVQIEQAYRRGRRTLKLIEKGVAAACIDIISSRISTSLSLIFFLPVIS